MRTRSTSTTATTSSSRTRGSPIGRAPIPSSWSTAASTTCSRPSAGLLALDRPGDVAAHHAHPLAPPRRRRAGRALGARHDLLHAGHHAAAADPDADRAGDGARRVLQSPYALAAAGARARSATPAPPDSVQPGPWDPQFFHDPDTERWFLYWNSSNVYPLHGIELDKSKRLVLPGTPRWLFGLDPATHGWERFGRDHRDTHDPSLHRGRVDDEARGTLLPAVRGAGHGVQRLRERHLRRRRSARPSPMRRTTRWRTSRAGSSRARGTATRSRTFTATGGTPARRWIGVNWNFERRIALFPRGLRRRRADVVSIRASATSRTGCPDGTRGIARRDCSPAGCCCPIANR